MLYITRATELLFSRISEKSSKSIFHREKIHDILPTQEGHGVFDHAHTPADIAPKPVE